MALHARPPGANADHVEGSPSLQRNPKMQMTRCAGAQRSFRWQDKQFFPTPQQPPTIAADEDPEIAASLEADAEEDAYRTAGLQQPKPVSQPERSSGKRKAKSSASQAGGEKQGAERALWREVGRF
ncbi:unnamed protein product [Gadus morhua 'NCC']